LNIPNWQKLSIALKSSSGSLAYFGMSMEGSREDQRLWDQFYQKEAYSDGGDNSFPEKLNLSVLPEDVDEETLLHEWAHQLYYTRLTNMQRNGLHKFLTKIILDVFSSFDSERPRPKKRSRFFKKKMIIESPSINYYLARKLLFYAEAYSVPKHLQNAIKNLQSVAGYVRPQTFFKIEQQIDVFHKLSGDARSLTTGYVFDHLLERGYITIDGKLTNKYNVAGGRIVLDDDLIPLELHDEIRAELDLSSKSLIPSLWPGEDDSDIALTNRRRDDLVTEFLSFSFGEYASSDPSKRALVPQELFPFFERFMRVADIEWSNRP
jgi:hypothetical protein